MSTAHDLDGVRQADESSVTSARPAADPVSRVTVLLLQGVVAAAVSAKDYQTVLAHQARLRDYFAVVHLDLVIDEAEGFAYLRSRRLDPDEAGTDPASNVPRLAVRRQLSFQVSLLLALLRRRLAEFDARGGETRLVLSRSDIVELVRVFLPERADDARLVAGVDTHINKVVELGFLRRLGSSATSGGGAAAASFEVQRTIKAFVDAHWLAELDERLRDYRAALERDLGLGGVPDHD